MSIEPYIVRYSFYFLEYFATVQHQTQICVTYQKVDCNPGINEFGLAFPCPSVMTARDFVHTYTT